MEIDMVNEIDTIVYAGRIKDKAVFMKSSSGGAFTALSDYFLDNRNAIVSAVYNYQKHTTEFQLIETKEDRDAAIGSKYMQSKLGNVFCDVSQWIIENQGRKLLFVGMGCQADGFRKYIEKNFREQVYIVDIICHGFPSPKLWKEYAELLEKQKKGKIDYLIFKDKSKGWKKPTAFVEINGKKFLLSEYVRIFYNCCALRSSCYKCPYTIIERKTDMTIGDFWHIEDTIPEFYDPNGNSQFLIHTDRGEWLFNCIKEKLDFRLSDTKQCWQKNLESPTPVSEYRQEFWEDYRRGELNL